MPAVAVLLVFLALFLVRYNAMQLLAFFEARFGPLLVTQHYQPMHWFWAFDNSEPIRVTRWFAVVILGFVSLFSLEWLPSLKATLNKLLQHPLAMPVIMLLGMLIFWYFRVLFAWGDTGRYEGYLRGPFGQDNTDFVPFIFFMSAPLTTALFYLAWITDLFASAEDAIAIVNVLAGGVYIWGGLRLIKSMTGKHAHYLQLLLLLSAPFLTLFFGYREATAVAAGCFSVYCYAGYQFLQTKSLRWFLLASLVIGISTAAHNIGIILIPAWAILFWVFIRSSIERKVLNLIVSGVLIALPLAIMFGFALTFPERVPGTLAGDALLADQVREGGLVVLLRRSCIGSGTAEPKGWCYALGSGYQLMDLANLTMFLFPGMFVLLPVMLGVVARNWQKISLVTLFALANVAAGAAFTILFPPVLGFLQDWDLFAPAYLLSSLGLLMLYLENETPWLHALKPVLFGAIALNLASLLELTFLLQTWLFGRVIFPMLG